MKYDLSEKLSQLLLNGYCFLPELTCLKASEYKKTLTENKEKLYEENNSLHLQYLEDYRIHEEVMPALADLATDILLNVKHLNDLYKVTRIINNNDSKEAYRAHFDSHLFTLVTPINIPHDPQSIYNGELILFNKIRKEPANEFENIFGKIKFKKYCGKDGVENLQKNSAYKILNLVDRTPVLFLGRQCLHCNLPLAASFKQPRVTFLTHFFDVSPVFSIGNLNRKLRGR